MDAGGALGALVVFAGYLVYQNKSLSQRNDQLVDRLTDILPKYEATTTEAKNAIERLADKIS